MGDRGQFIEAMKTSIANQFDSGEGQQFLQSAGRQRNDSGTFPWEARFISVVKALWGRPHRGVTPGGLHDAIEIYTDQHELWTYANPPGSAGDTSVTFVDHTNTVDWITGVVDGGSRYLRPSNPIYAYNDVTNDLGTYRLWYVTGAPEYSSRIIYPNHTAITPYAASWWLTSQIVTDSNFVFEVVQAPREVDFGSPPVVTGEPGGGGRRLIEVSVPNPYERNQGRAQDALDSLSIEDVPWGYWDSRKFNEWIVKDIPA